MITCVVWLLSLSGCKQSGPKSTSVQRPPQKLTIQQIAEKTTVSIVGKGVGSGVIIHKNGNTYYVLTSKHVVGIPPGESEDKYKIITFDKKEYEINYEKVIVDAELDLAILEFVSDTGNYQLATISNSKIPQNKTVYVSGWKDCSSGPKYELTNGKVDKILTSKRDGLDEVNKTQKGELKYEEEDYKEGYRVKYTNPTIRGMSGSPVFDDESNLVAIHGKPGHDKENQYRFDQCKNLDQSQSFGNNWGIPMNEFLNSSLGSNLQLKRN